MSILYDTNFIVALSFVLFLGLLVWMGVPGKLTKALDDRSSRIRGELEDARQLREEAQRLLASYERKQKDVEKQAEAIIARAGEEAKAAAESGKADLAAAVERRLKAAKDQIASAEAAAVKDVRDTAIAVAVASARDVISKNISAKQGNDLIDAAISEAGKKLN